MTQRSPRAADLAARLHCSACGETDPAAEDGYTACCNKRACHGMGPEAQDACCSAVQERMEHEAAHGAPPAAARRSTPPAARRRPTARRSTQTRETPDLHDGEHAANLVSHQGGAAPTPPDPKEPEMARSPYSRATSTVIRKLMADGPNSFEPVGYRFGHDRATFQQAATAYLKDATALATKTIEGADWDEVYAAFRDEAPAAPAAPRKAARQALGAASADGWDLLYDKPRQGCEVGRRYVDGKPQYALICKAHGHVHKLPRLTTERSVRTAGGWCPDCQG